MPLAEQLLGSLGQKKKKRPPVPNMSPDAVLHTPSAQPPATVGHTSPGVPALTPLAASGGVPSAPASNFLQTPTDYLRENVVAPLRAIAGPARAQAPDARRPREERPSILEALDRPFNETEQIRPRHAALLAEYVGLPGKTYAQEVIPGESNFRPGVRNPDDATPSLFQITPSVQTEATQAKFDQIAAQHKGGYSNPVAAAKMAAFLAGSSADEGLSNYVAWTGENPGHIRGGAERAARLLNRPAPPGMPTPDGAGRPPISANELFYDPGVNLVDNAPTDAIGGHDTHVHFGSNDPRSILRAARVAEKMGLRIGENEAYEGSPVEDVHTTNSMHYSTVPITAKQARRFDLGSAREIGTALDVSDPEGTGKLAAYNARLAQMAGAPLAPSTGIFAAPATGSAYGGGGGGYVDTPGARDPVPLLGTSDPAATGEVAPPTPLPFGAAAPSAAAPVAGTGRRSARQTPEETMALLRLLAEEEERYG